MYEYDVLTSDKLISKEQLNGLAKDRWRLVTIVAAMGKYFFYLERPVHSA